MKISYPVYKVLRHTLIHYHLAFYPPGQGAKHDLAVSVLLPSHGFPPFIGGGRLHNLVLLRMLPPDIPQVLEHCVH